MNKGIGIATKLGHRIDCLYTRYDQQGEKGKRMKAAVGDRVQMGDGQKGIVLKITKRVKRVKNWGVKFTDTWYKIQLDNGVFVWVFPNKFSIIKWEVR